MKFDELQVIWDSQTSQPTFTIDLDTLRSRVAHEARRAERGVTCSELGMVAISAGLAFYLAWDPILHGRRMVHLFGAFLMLCVSGWMLRLRKNRLWSARGFEPTLVGDVDRAIAEIDHHIAMERTFQWWFLLPALVIVLIDFASGDELRPLTQIPIVAVGFLISYFVVRASLRCVHGPKKRDLESLRAKLTEAD